VHHGRPTKPTSNRPIAMQAQQPSRAGPRTGCASARSPAVATAARTARAAAPPACQVGIRCLGWAERLGSDCTAASTRGVWWHNSHYGDGHNAYRRHNGYERLRVNCRSFSCVTLATTLVHSLFSPWGKVAPQENKFPMPPNRWFRIPGPPSKLAKDSPAPVPDPALLSAPREPQASPAGTVPEK